ncbi:MAG: hypothetical protein ACHQ53_08450 [Polyangiales bacterium]
MKRARPGPWLCAWALVCAIGSAARADEPIPRAQPKPAPAKARKSEADSADVNRGKDRSAAGRSSDQYQRSARNALWTSLRHGLRAPRELPASVRDELRLHAQRVSRLQRIRALCIERKDQATLLRADKLLAVEHQRHRDVLARAWPSPAPSQAAGERPVVVKDDDSSDDQASEPEGEDEEEQEAKP